MFEKSLVDLIRALRAHKGTEAEYIQSALKECRAEIRSQDMDVKATAMLKLIYLEMFGYDMTWAAFNVLEVMSSAKQMQKRVGYLAAVQTFRPDTEVLMLATNLLKKDLSSPTIPVMTLPLITLPHIITSSLALSVLTDLLPRLSHSQPAVRKKTIVTLYRLALVYPETLRVAWPKIKERLLDEEENSSVTAATVNVVCELGWRRPNDFLSLAPRLFELLVDGGNNWMAIKIIKLFAVLTPLEPRLVKKLVRPLSSIIQGTSAMSLLYECINGIIQGGILSAADGGSEQDEVASLCIRKLREMVLVDGDPNLKYVALLAFNKIAASYKTLVSLQEDVILGCLEDPDISIRLQALELASSIVNTENLQSIVDRLLKQLSRSHSPDDVNGAGQDEEMTDMEQKLIPDKRASDTPPLPDDYRKEVLNRILDLCSNDSYQNVNDFEWYLDILVRMIRLVPSDQPGERTTVQPSAGSSIAARIGHQLLDTAVRIQELRPETTRAAENLVMIANRQSLFSLDGSGRGEVLKSAAWVVGEFASHLASCQDTLSSLIHESSTSLPFSTLAIYVQAVPKIFGFIAKRAGQDWTPSQRSTLSLQLARAISFLEKLATHPNLDVQERSVEYLELLRLASEDISSQAADETKPPMLLTAAIPNLYHDGELNPVAAGAQRKVPEPTDIDFDAPINPDLPSVLRSSQAVDAEDSEFEEYRAYYHDHPAPTAVASSQATLQTTKPVQPAEEYRGPVSYQSAPESPGTIARRRAERHARHKDDPFYIPQRGDSGTSTPLHEILSKENGENFDIDDIPIVALNLESNVDSKVASQLKQKQKKKKPTRRFNVTTDETIEDPTSSDDPKSATKPLSATNSPHTKPAPTTRIRQNLLSVDSSTLGSFSLEAQQGLDPLEIERREQEEAEMAAAMREVERLRLEMQRHAEQATVADGVDLDGTVVVKKKKKKKRIETGEAVEGRGVDGGLPAEEGEVGTVRKKKKKKKRVIGAVTDGEPGQEEGGLQ